MPVIPQFEPASAPGSLMQRAIQSRRQEEVHQMERDKFEIMRPVLESQARVQLITDAAHLSFQKQMADYAAEQIHSIPELTQEWTGIQKISNPTQRLSAMSEFIGRTAPLEAIPAAKPMVETWRNLHALDSNAQKTDALVSGRAETAGIQADAKMAKTQADNDAKIGIAMANLAAKEAAVKAQMDRLEVAQKHDAEMKSQAQTHATEVATMKDETARRGQDIAAEVKQAQLDSLNNRPLNQAAVKENNLVLDKARTALPALQRVDEAITLMNDPELRTGTGAGFIAAVKRAGGLLGADTTNVSKLEQLQSVFGTIILENAKLLKGTISDKDVAFLKGMSPDVAKTPEGNKALLTIIRRQLADIADLGDVVQKSRAEKLPESEVQWNVNDFFTKKYPNATAAPQPPPATSSVLTSEEQNRLLELRAKKAAAGR